MRSDGTIIPEVKDAMARGIIFDTATGRSNLCYEVVRKCFAQGILPTTISTDLNHDCLTDRTYGLPVIMSKFLALGLDLGQVITMTTINPARALGEDDKIGSLKPGMEADVSILKFQPGAWKLIDTPGEIIETDELLMPVSTIKGGQIIPAEPFALPPD